MKKRNENPLKAQHQMGMTLIEIMIAMGIGLFLIAGVVQLLVTTRQSYNVQDAVARIEENSRFSLGMLSENIRLAGYKKGAWESNSTTFATANTLFAAGEYISGSEGGISSSDQINIRFHGSVNNSGNVDGRVIDCEGNGVGDTNVELSFSISGSDLICTVDGTTPPVVLAGNISNMQILYGEDTSDDDTVNKYVTASSVSNWNNIISVKIGLVFGSEKNNLANTSLSFPSLSENPMNAIFDRNSDGEPDLFKATGSTSFNSKTAPDRHLYKIYNTTVTLRNRLL